MYWAYIDLGSFSIAHCTHQPEVVKCIFVNSSVKHVPDTCQTIPVLEFYCKLVFIKLFKNL